MFDERCVQSIPRRRQGSSGLCCDHDHDHDPADADARPTLSPTDKLHARYATAPTGSGPRFRAMSRAPTNNWQPPRNGGPRHQNHNQHQNQNRPNRDWKEKKDIQADDQIAPKPVTRSTHSLAQWARLTADFPQQGCRANERQMMDRIQRRYEDPHAHRNGLFPRYTNAPGGPATLQDRHLSDSYSRDTLNGSATKRPRSTSPPLSARRPQHEASTVAYVRSTKRRRTRSPSPAPSYRKASLAGRMTIDLTEDDDNYAQSSEWSFPDSELEDRDKIVDLT
jgi:hypothetical protein